jgi:putative spermidine/putrescine transport system substrate-binding protein
LLASVEPEDDVRWHEVFAMSAAHPDPGAPTLRLSRRSLVTAAGALVVLGPGCTDRSASEDVLPDFLGTPAAAAVGGEAGRWAGRTLRVSAFGGQVEDALRSLVWEPFAGHTGCMIESVLGSFWTSATPIPTGVSAALGAAPAADLVLADPISAAAAAANGELATLPSDVASLGQIGRLGGPFAVPAFAYALVNARRRDAFPEAMTPASWADWWDGRRFPGGRSLGRGPTGTLEVALLADGVPAAELYPLALPRALAALDRIVSAIGKRWWTRGLEPVGWLGNGHADLASAWHHRVVAGQWDGLAVDLTWRDALLVVDQWVVPAATQEPEVAADLIKFASTPERQAALARETRLGPVVSDALRWIEPWLLPTIPTAPPHGERLVPLDPAWWASNRATAQAEFDRWFNSAAM